MTAMAYLFLFIFWTGAIMLKPRKNVAGKRRIAKTAFLKLRSFFQGNAAADEISDALGYIRNTAILGRSRGLSAQQLLTELAGISEKLKTVYEEMARHLSMGEKDEAEEVFTSAVSLEISSGIARLLSGWDDIDPEDILETVSVYQSLLREKRITADKRKNEILSDLIYIPVVINCMLVLINFIYISFFIRQQESLFILYG